MSRFLALLALGAIVAGVLYGTIRLYGWAHDSSIKLARDHAAGKMDAAKFRSASPEQQRRMLAGRNTDYMFGLGLESQFGLRVFKDAAGNYWIFSAITSASNDVPGTQIGPLRRQ